MRRLKTKSKKTESKTSYIKLLYLLNFSINVLISKLGLKGLLIELMKLESSEENNSRINNDKKPLKVKLQ